MKEVPFQWGFSPLVFRPSRVWYQVTHSKFPFSGKGGSLSLVLFRTRFFIFL